MCAALGLIPGQGGRDILFAKAPNTLDYSRSSERLGKCTGWSARGYEWCKKDGYATDSIFFLEVRWAGEPRPHPATLACPS